MTDGNLRMLEMPFVFNQLRPLSTRQFIAHAKDRGLLLDHTGLRDLHAVGLLSPLVEVVDDVVRGPMPVVVESAPGASLTRELRSAQADGRVLDPATERPPTGDRLPTKPLRFDGRSPDDPRHWWNGLVYSRWQLLYVRWLRHWAANDALRARDRISQDSDTNQLSNEILEIHRDLAQRHRRLAVALTVLEPRYLPELEGVIRSSGRDDLHYWYEWRASYKPAAVSNALGWDAALVLAEAERLLSDAKSVDPLGKWSRLVRRAPRKKWESLRGDALVAMELRLGAEILLMFHEDLTGTRVVVPGEGRPGRFAHPLDERLTADDEALDRTLSSLGVSPHPGAVLLVEGETERLLFTRIFEHLGLSGPDELVRVVTMNGTGKGLEMLAVALVAPVLGQPREDSYELVRPPCRLIIAVDPDKGWDTPAKAEGKRLKLVETIRGVARAQAPDVDLRDLDNLVSVHLWKQPCFEYAHFSDHELLEAITTVHTEPRARPGNEEILRLLDDGRHSGHDISKVWHDWAHTPSKPRMADALWPTLRTHIDAATSGAGAMPEAAQVATAAIAIAEQYCAGTWIIPRKDPLASPSPDAPTGGG